MPRTKYGFVSGTPEMMICPLGFPLKPTKKRFLKKGICIKDWEAESLKIRLDLFNFGFRIEERGLEAVQIAAVAACVFGCSALRGAHSCRKSAGWVFFEKRGFGVSSSAKRTAMELLQLLPTCWFSHAWFWWYGRLPCPPNW